jgi:5-methyltetrahydrofolate--homocysteine methyltransferase
MSLLEDLRKSVIDGNLNAAQNQVRAALAENIPAEKILTDGLISAMTEVGRMFEAGEFYVPEMLISARAMKGGLAILRPELAAAHIQAVGKAVIGTVQGDLHDIGKNLVGMMLEGAGFEVIDLGVDVAPEKFAAEAKARGVNLIGMSALLTTTMPGMEKTVKALQQAGLQVKIMVGGAPVTQGFADKIGAHGYAPDAASAVDTAKKLVA